MEMKDISYSNLEPIIREQLEHGGKVRLKPNGVSMLPLIEPGQDEVMLKKPHGRLKKYDIIFYKRKSGQFVLHRIIKVRKDDYVVCGDGQFIPEYNVTDDMIIAKVSGIIREHKYSSIKSSWQRKYARRHVFEQKTKYFVYRCKRKLKSILKRSKKEQSTNQE